MSEDLKQENEKLNARLQKAVQVFTEQKATIKRLTEERDAAVAKTSAAEAADEQFFAQEQEINNLNTKISELTEQHNLVTEERDALLVRIEKASEAFKKQKEEIESLTADLNSSDEELAKAKEYIVRMEEECVKAKEFIGSIKNKLEEYLK